MPHDLPKSIGRPATSALRAFGVNTLEQVANYTETEILALHGVGPKAIRLLKEAFEEHGLSFNPERIL